MKKRKRVVTKHSRNNSEKIYADPFVFLKQEAIVEIEDAISHQFGKKIALNPNLLETPPDQQLGDIALPCFALVKELSLSPAAIAEKLTADINESIQVGLQLSHGMSVEHIILTLASAQAVGPYLNLRFNSSALAHWIIPAILRDSTYGTTKQKKPKKILIEYVSPNTNKPLHIGHARNAVLGDSLSRILESQGSTVIRTSLVNDRGIHICKSMVAYLENAKIKNKKSKLPTPKSTNIKEDHFVGGYYVLYEKILKENSHIAESAQECLQKWEEGNAKTRALWKKMNGWALKGINETYKRLGIAFNKTYFESDLYLHGKNIILSALKKGLFKRDASGAVIADLSEYNLPEKVLLRSDGTSLYVTQDIYLALLKRKEFRMDASVYVIGSEQNLYLQQLFAILKKLKLTWAHHLFHLSYGMVSLPDGRIKSREGTVADTDTLLDQLEAMVVTEIKKREKNLPAKEVLRRAKTIALSALKFYILEVTPKSDMTFNPNTSLSLQGKTGPYMLYTYARLVSILRKASIDTKCDIFAYNWKHEQTLLLRIGKLPEVIREAAQNHSPAVLAQFLFALAQETNDYYHSVPVLSAAHNERCARLLLVASVARVLKTGLELLGIDTLEKM